MKLFVSFAVLLCLLSGCSKSLEKIEEEKIKPNIKLSYKPILQNMIQVGEEEEYALFSINGENLKAPINIKANVGNTHIDIEEITSVNEKSVKFKILKKLLRNLGETTLELIIKNAYAEEVNFSVPIKVTDGTSPTMTLNGVIDAIKNDNILMAELKGDQGSIGPQGPKGDTGPQGPQGIQGDPYKWTKHGNCAFFSNLTWNYKTSKCSMTGISLIPTNLEACSFKLLSETNTYFPTITISKSSSPDITAFFHKEVETYDKETLQANVLLITIKLVINLTSKISYYQISDMEISIWENGKKLEATLDGYNRAAELLLNKEYTFELLSKCPTEN